MMIMMMMNNDSYVSAGIKARTPRCKSVTLTMIIIIAINVKYK